MMGTYLRGAEERDQMCEVAGHILYVVDKVLSSMMNSYICMYNWGFFFDFLSLVAHRKILKQLGRTCSSPCLAYERRIVSTV